jgi:cation diffusion facilitator CzcD-associated flavoprotein CzcO
MLKSPVLNLSPIRRVAVIGAGPSGAAAAEALKQAQAFDVIRVFERRGEVGGAWYVTWHICSS